ncbi:MAG: hypothetical protein ACNA7V_07390 [Bacteroidales bacterium]
MVSVDGKIDAFIQLGDWLRSIEASGASARSTDSQELKELIGEAHNQNPWFIPEFVRYALKSIGESLKEDKIRMWLSNYPDLGVRTDNQRTVAVINAGNIPLVGFHDFLCITLSGHRYLGKLSTDDRVLLPAIVEKLIAFEPGLEGYFNFPEGKLSDFDAVIATGSNNSARYFDYYFGRYPHIIRKNRNGVAILTGHEDQEEMELLADDIFLYFGLGCRSVAKLFIPRGYTFDNLFRVFEKYRSIVNLHKYMNNYDYYRSTFLVNGTGHLDTGFLLVKEDMGFSSPPAVLFIEFYDNLDYLKNRLIQSKEEIQCMVGRIADMGGVVPFGKAQNPDLWDYSDGVDTLGFLTGLK